jgi:hypothetical protein
LFEHDLLRKTASHFSGSCLENNHREDEMKFAHIAVPACLAFVVTAASPASAQTAETSFFVTSNGIGNGGNLGGLAGADNHCQTLAQAAGFGAPKTWRAYLSTQAADGKPAVNARDRIGTGTMEERERASWSPRTSPTCTVPATR